MRYKTSTFQKAHLKLTVLFFTILITNLLACKSSMEEDLQPVDEQSSETVLAARDLDETAEKGSYHLKGYTLKDVFDFPIGAAVVYERLNQPLYANTLKREFSRVSSESNFKFKYLQPEEGKYDWEKADGIVDFALKNNMKVHGHTLLWANDGTYPAWLRNKEGSPEVFDKIMKDHITTVLRHFKGKIQSWDVINESLTPDGKYVDNLFLRKLGPDYIYKAFKYAREADPSVKLFINDFSLEYAGKKLKRYLAMSDELAERGVKIDGIAFQMHAVLRIAMPLVEKSLKMAGDKGLLVYLSEFDVALRYNMPKVFPLTDLLSRQQGQKYKEIVKAYLDNVPKRQQWGITTWGVGDKDSYFNKGYVNFNHDHPLLFGVDYKAKWAYRGFIEAGLGRQNKISLD